MFRSHNGKRKQLPFLSQQNERKRPTSFSDVTRKRICKRLAEEICKNVVLKAKHSSSLIDKTPILEEFEESYYDQVYNDPCGHAGLKAAGNYKVWSDIIEHFQFGNGPALISGPTGCGKSYGVYIISKLLNHHVYEIGPSECDSVSNMEMWIKQVCSTTTLKGKSLVFIDDIEGLEREMLSKISNLCKKMPRAAIIMCCTDPYAQCLRDLRKITWFRLWRPKPEHLVAWSKTQSLFKSHKSKDYLQKQAQLADGDLRQFILRIHTSLNMKDVNRQSNMFEDFKRLQQGNLSVDQWSQTEGGAHACQFAHCNLANIGDSMETCSNLSDMISFSEYSFPWPHNGFRGKMIGQFFKTYGAENARLTFFIKPTVSEENKFHLDFFSILNNTLK